MIIVVVLEDADEGDERKILEDARAAIEEEGFTNAKGSVCEPGAAKQEGGGGAEKKLHEKIKFFSSLKSTQLFQGPLLVLAS